VQAVQLSWAMHYANAGGHSHTHNMCDGMDRTTPPFLVQQPTSTQCSSASVVLCGAHCAMPWHAQCVATYVHIPHPPSFRIPHARAGDRRVAA
jgi:hypothetical protein